MSSGENNEEYTELPDSNPTKLPTKASAEKVSGLATKKLADEGKVVVVKPSEIEYKEDRTEYSSAEEQNKTGEGDDRLLLPKLNKLDNHSQS